RTAAHSCRQRTAMVFPQRHQRLSAAASSSNCSRFQLSLLLPGGSGRTAKRVIRRNDCQGACILNENPRLHRSHEPRRRRLLNLLAKRQSYEFPLRKTRTWTGKCTRHCAERQSAAQVNSPRPLSLTPCFSKVTQLPAESTQ